MISRASVIVMALFVAAATAPAFSGGVCGAHPYHETLAEVEYNPDTLSLEIAVRFDPISLEHALSVSARKRVTSALDNFETLLEQYVGERFAAKAAGGDQAELVWVGVEHAERDTWVYFELVFEAPPDSVVLSNLLLVEINPYQVNTVLYRAGVLKMSVLMSAEEPVLRVPCARLEL